MIGNINIIEGPCDETTPSIQRVPSLGRDSAEDPLFKVKWGNVLGDINKQTDLTEMISELATGSIVDGSISTAKLAESSITTEKIATGAVTSAELATDSVTTDKILAAAVTSAEIQDAAVTTAKIADISITGAKIKDAAITGSKIANGAISNLLIANGSVDDSKLANDSVTNQKIENSSVDSDKIVDGSITNAKMAADSVNTSELVDNSVTTIKIANLNVTEGKLALGSVTNTKLATGSVTTDKINNASVTVDKLADNSVSTEKLSPFYRNIATGKQVIRNHVNKNTINQPTKLFWSEPLEFPDGTHKIISNLGNYQGITNVKNEYIENPSDGTYNIYDASLGKSSFLITGTGVAGRTSTDNGVVYTTGLGETVGDGCCGVMNDGTPVSLRIVNTAALAKYIGKNGDTIHPNFDNYTVWGNDDSVGVIIKDTSITAGTYNIDRIRLSGRFRYYSNISKYVMIGKNYNPNNAVTETTEVDGADANQNYAPTNVYLITTTDFNTFSYYKIMSYNQTATYGTRIGQINPVEPTFELFDNGNICVVVRNNGENVHGATFCADGSLETINSTTKWYLYRYNKSFCLMVANIDSIIAGTTPVYDMGKIVNQIDNQIALEEDRTSDIVTLTGTQMAGPFIPKEGYKLSEGGHFCGVLPRIARRVINDIEYAVFLYYNRHLVTGKTKLNRSSLYCTVVPFSELLTNGVTSINNYSCHLVADHSQYVSAGEGSPEGGNNAITTYPNGIAVFCPVSKSTTWHGSTAGGEMIFIPDDKLIQYYYSDIYDM